ncbi:unnamed protein product [Arctia plantaginis]|uniref:Uncharacterized protein n=1 Tax=Arctia plantaginis TaxID=874455 RepID=A0A8S0ZZI0_ARCPL|nr:unnamed protein product [Arctia plantaginis]
MGYVAGSRGTLSLITQLILDLYRICPSQLTKHELEDLYFTVLETNIQLRKTINEQQERIKTLCNKTQRKTSALKVLQDEERKNCCVFTNIKVKQQKESLENLRRAHEKTAERVRKLNTQVCSTNHNSRLCSPNCAQNNSSKCIKNTTSTAKHMCNSAQISAQAEEKHTASTAKHQCHSAHMDAQTYEKDKLQPAEIQTELQNKTPYKYHEKEGQKDTLCDENRCRTLMDELKLKITHLVEELAQTHKKYSDRISRLEDGVHEYRKENTQMDSKRMVEGQEVSLPSESYWNKLVNNLRNSAAYSADLEVQLEKEKKKVSELLSQLRLSQLHNQLTQEHQLINKKVMKPSFKHQCTSKCYSENNTPAKSSISSNTSNKNNYDVAKNNDIVNSNKDQGLSITTKSVKLSDIDNGQYQTNTEENKNMTNNSKRILNGNNKKGTMIAPSVEPYILEDTKNRDFTNTETSPGVIENYNVDIEDKTPALPAANRMQTVPATSVRNSVDMSRNRTKGMFDFNKTNEISEYTENENNDTDDRHESQNGTATDRSERNTKDFTEVNDNQSKDLKIDDKKMSQEKADIKKVNEKTNANGSRNSVDANKQQFLSKRRSKSVLSNVYQNRNMASPSFLVKCLEGINEDQTKTVAELKRQQNTSQKQSGKTEKAQNVNLIPNVDSSIESDDNIPQDTIGLMRTLSTLTVKMNTTEERDDKKDSMDNKSQSQNSQNPSGKTEKAQNDNLISNVDNSNESDGNIPQDTIGLMRTLSTLTVKMNTTQERDDKKDSMDNKSLTDNSQNPSGKTEKAQNYNLIPCVVNSNESDGNIPLDTIGLMRALSTLAVQKNTTEERDDKKDSMDNKSQTHNSQNPLPADLDSNLNPETSQNRTVVGSYSIPEETMGLLRLISTVRENIRKNTIDREKSQKTPLEAALDSKVEVPKQESSTKPVAVGPDQHNAQTQSAISEERYRNLDDDRCSFKDVNEVFKEIKETKVELERLKEQLKSKKEINKDLLTENTENIPTKDNEIEEGFNKNGRGAVMNDERKISGASMNYSLQPNTELLKQVKDVVKESQVEVLPEKLEVRENTVSSTAQREIATYRRNSGTLCFKTVPASKRSQLCQCDEQSYCEIVQNKGTQTVSEINNGSQNEQNCATGHIKCTRTIISKNMISQTPKTFTMSGSTANRPSKQSNEHKFGDLKTQSLNNYLNGKKEAVQTNASFSRNEYNTNKSNSLGTETSTASDKDIKGTLITLKEELERCKQLARQNNLIESGMEIHNTLETKVSEEVLNEFDAGCQLKRGQAMHSVNEQYLPRCVFVLHIGTVVLSDEAVLISRGKSLGLTWKFYDQDVMTTRMRAGRVVVFDFSTEYDTPLTNEFLNYMKHDELKILICQLDQPNKPIASCSLPLRDALLNTNRRADMSLALVAGPQIMYARQRNNVSDILDAGDEMGVLDLWCMLRADAKFIPLINKAIARESKPTLLSREHNMSDSKRNEKQRDKIPTKQFKPLDKKSQQNDDFSLHRWGSSVLKLPSRQTSKESSDKIKQENDLEGQSDINVQDCRRLDSSGFKMPDTVEIDQVTPRKKLTMLHSPVKKSKTKPKKTPSRTTSAAAQYNDDQESMIIDEVFANIRTSDDMKRVMNRREEFLHGESRFDDSELDGFKDTEKQNPARQPGQHQSTDMSNTTFLSNIMEDHNSKKTRRFETASTLSQDISLEPAVLLPRISFGSKRSDITDINRKYDNIAKLYAKYNAQKNEGTRADQTKKQVKINSKRASKVSEEPKKDKPEEEELSIDITILWLALNEECEAMLNPRVQRVYVSYEFLGYSGADLETPVSLPKPKHYVDKCYFNFKKTFQIEKDDMPMLGEMARCRATSQVSKTDKDCIVFSVISEPPEDPLGLDICEDIGYAYLYLGDLLAYGVGSPGYTEVVPVRSRSGTSVCGVLAVRLDGLDVLRRCLEIVDSQMPPS